MPMHSQHAGRAMEDDPEMMDPNAEGMDTEPGEGDDDDAILQELLGGAPGSAAQPGTSGTPPPGGDAGAADMARQAVAAQDQLLDSEAAQTLIQQGVPQPLVPQLVEAFRTTRQLARENQMLRAFLQKLDQDPNIIETTARQVAKKYEKFGVTPEVLTKMKPRNAEEMDRIAQTLAYSNRKHGVQERKKEGRDSFETPDSSGLSGGKLGKDYFDLSSPGISLIKQGLQKRRK